MKVILLKIFIIATLLVGAAKCDNGGSDLIMIGFEREMSLTQIDSLCNADVLDSNLDNWIRASFIDYETGLTTTKYSFIKEYNDSTEIVYIITHKNDEYSVLKRIVKVE